MNDTVRQRVLDHMGMVKLVVRRMAHELPGQVERDDLIGAGLLGLMDAAMKFDASQDVQFWSYAEHRVRGAIVDELRAADWIPRTARARIRESDLVYQALTHELMREPTAEEMRERLSREPERAPFLLSLDERRGGEGDEEGIDLLSLLGADPGESGFDRLCHDQAVAILDAALREISPSEADVIVMYYRWGLTMAEIGESMGVTESRVSQIHAAGLNRLRVRLERTLGADAGVGILI